MYQYYYETLVVKYGSKIQLLYTDTDSLMVCLQSKNIKQDLEKIKETLDTSNFNKNHPLYSPKNASELFYVKMELPAHTILAGVFLKAKSYALLISPNTPQFEHENKNTPSSDYQVREDKLLQLHRCKGVPGVARQNLLFEHFVSILSEHTKSHRVVFHKIASKAHTLHTIFQRKLALSAYEDKRQLLNCSIHTKPYGDSTMNEHFKCMICK